MIKAEELHNILCELRIDCRNFDYEESVWWLAQQLVERLSEIKEDTDENKR